MGIFGPWNYGMDFMFKGGGVCSGEDRGQHTSVKVGDWIIHALQPLLQRGCRDGTKQPWTKHALTGIPIVHGVWALTVTLGCYFHVTQKLFFCFKNVKGMMNREGLVF